MGENAFMSQSALIGDAASGIGKMPHSCCGITTCNVVFIPKK